MRGNLPLAPLCPLPARLPYQHSFASTEGGVVGSRGRYHTVCRSSGEYTDGNPRRQAKDPFVEQINNDASRNSGLNLSLRYDTVVPYSVLHKVLATDSFLFTARTVKGKVGRRTGPGGGLAVSSSTCPQCITYALRSVALRLAFGNINSFATRKTTRHHLVL